MRQHNQRIICFLWAGFLMAAGPNQVMAKQQFFEASKRVVVLDAGHGGDETGARGTDGTAEKTVTLNLARLLAKELEHEYKIVLTRTDNYALDLDKRTALANHHKANIFISLHTGGSFAHNTSGISIYYYHNFSEMPGSTQTQTASGLGRDNRGPLLWEFAQDLHQEKSRTLARLVIARLNAANPDLESQLQGAPLAVLQGADMPAILIEIGYLTNPAEEKKLRDQRYLANLALAIKRGIDEYFKQAP